ncbi:MAG: DMT family transporter [Rhizobiaceae bacterium]
MRLLDWATLIALGALWGASFYFIGVAVREIDPLTLVFLRVAIAAGALWIIVLLTRQKLDGLAENFPALFVLALINNVVPFTLIFIGQTAIGAGLASVLNATTPFWTIVIAWLFGIEREPPAHKLAGIAVGVVGAAIMIGPGIAAGLGGPVWAKLAIIGAAISYGFAAAWARRFSSLPPLLVATGQLTGSSVAMLPIMAFAGIPATAFGASETALSAVIALALLSTAFAYVLYFRLIASAGATNASLVTMIVPASALALGVLFLGERLETWEIAGMLVVLAGLVTIDGRVFHWR